MSSQDEEFRANVLKISAEVSTKLVELIRAGAEPSIVFRGAAIAIVGTIQAGIGHEHDNMVEILHRMEKFFAETVILAIDNNAERTKPVPGEDILAEFKRKMGL